MRGCLKEEVPRRILMTADTVGGVWRYALELATGLALREIRVILVVLGPEPNAQQRTEAEAIPELELLTPGWCLDWTAPSQRELDSVTSSLTELADATGAQTAHVHAPALIGAHSWPIPVAAVVHSCVGTWWRAVHDGPLPEDLAWRQRATALGIERASAVIAPSASFATELKNVYRPGRTIKVVHNGRRPPRATSKGRRPAVMAAGRLWDPGKNIALLEQVAALVQVPIRAAGPISGPNGERVELHGVKTLGALDETDLMGEFAAASVFACPSRYEPFGLAVLEAAQLGTPLLLSDIPTFRELWADAALFIDPVSVDDWAGAISSLLELAAVRAALGAAALCRSRQFSQSAMVDATLEVHRSIRMTSMAQ